MATKIMYLVDRYPDPQGGTEGQLLQLVQHLDRSRYEPSMTVFRSSAYIEHNLFPCPVRVLNITKLLSAWTIYKIFRYVLILRREHYQLVHCYFNDTSLLAPIFLKFFGIRVLVSRRDMGFWYTSRNLAVLRLVALFVDRYVVNSQAVKRIVQQQEWVPCEKVTVIYNGFAPSMESDDRKISIEKEMLVVPEGVPIIGIVANLRPIKRIDMLVKAFALVSRSYPNARLIIVGDTLSMQGKSTLSELENLASSLEVRERVIFVGRVKKPILYINQFTVAVLCSESEGFSNSIIEYMQAGCPVICTDTGGNSELIQHGRNGFLVPVGDVSALADSLVRLLSNSVLARSLGQAGYETTCFYTHTRMVAEQMACYDEVISDNHSRLGFYRRPKKA